MSDIKVKRGLRVRGGVATAPGKRVSQMNECAVKYVSQETRKRLREVAKLPKGRALIRALLDYYTEETSEARGLVYDRELAPLVSLFDARDHSDDLTKAFSVVRELVEAQYLTPVMQVELRAEVNHVIGG